MFQRPIEVHRGRLDSTPRRYPEALLEGSVERVSRRICEGTPRRRKYIPFNERQVVENKLCEKPYTCKGACDCHPRELKSDDCGRFEHVERETCENTPYKPECLEYNTKYVREEPKSCRQECIDDCENEHREHYEEEPVCEGINFEMTLGHLEQMDKKPDRLYDQEKVKCPLDPPAAIAKIRNIRTCNN